MFSPAEILSVKNFKIINGKTSIQLNNDTKWIYQGTDLFESQESQFSWKLGDRLRIAYVFPNSYYLQNMSCAGCIPVKLINAQLEKIETVRIQHISKKEGATSQLILDDRTEWYIGSWSSIWVDEWKAGDRLLISPQTFIAGKATHLIINIDNEMKCIRAQLMDSPFDICLEDTNFRPSRTWLLSLVNQSADEYFLQIELSNKTVWLCDLPKKAWESEDQITIQVEDTDFYLVNGRESIKAILSNPDHFECVSVLKVSKDAQKITLDDGSIWILDSTLDSFKKWRQGDRIFISSISNYLDASTHRLINCERVIGKKKDSNLMQY